MRWIKRFAGDAINPNYSGPVVRLTGWNLVFGYAQLTVLLAFFQPEISFMQSEKIATGQFSCK